jgi:hypothetical protein
MKLREKQCLRQIQIVFESQDRFVVQHNGKQHSCETAPIETTTVKKMEPEVIERIQNLFRAGVRMPKKVHMILRSERGRNEIQYDVEPTINQIKYQIQKYKKEIIGEGEISLGELKAFLDKHSEVPEDDDQPFVLGYMIKIPKRKLLEISSENDTDNKGETIDRPEDFEIPSFWFLFTTVRLLNLLTMTNLIAADSTFKLVWQGFSEILIGTVDMKKQFHKICFGMSTSEKTTDWQEMFQVSIKIKLFKN